MSNSKLFLLELICFVSIHRVRKLEGVLDFSATPEPRGGMGNLLGLSPISVDLQAPSNGKTRRMTGCITTLEF